MSESQKILQRLQKLSEPKLRRLLINFSKNELGESAELHGFGEHGVDVVAFIKPDFDPIGLGQVILIQVKKSKITMPSWRKTLSGQLSEIYFRTIRALNINENSPRRIVLVHNEMNTSVQDAISDWNKKMPIPIEMLSLHSLSILLERKGYKARHIKRITES